MPDEISTINVSAGSDDIPYSVSGVLPEKDAQKLMLLALGNDPHSKGLKMPKGNYTFRLTMVPASE